KKLKRRNKYLFILFSLFCCCNHTKDKSVISDSVYERVISHLKNNQQTPPFSYWNTPKFIWNDTSLDVVMFDTNEDKQETKFIDSIIEINSKFDTNLMRKQID